MQFARFIYGSILRLYGASNIIEVYEFGYRPIIVSTKTYTKSSRVPKSPFKKIYKAFKWLLSLYMLWYFINVPRDMKLSLNGSNLIKIEETYLLTPNQVRIAKLLPWQLYSKLTGKITSIYVPSILRSPLYTSFLTMAHGNIGEVEKDLQEYKTFNEFFTRKLKTGSRIIDTSSDGIINSPVDGKVLYLGKIDHNSSDPQLEQVKGVKFSLKQFLGDIPNTKYNLYYYIIYLSPGDYHRVHSSYNWTSIKCKHFPGYLFSVHPMIANRIRGLFSINERIVMEGYNNDKFYSMSLVGASGVGSMIINGLKELKTNNGFWDNINKIYKFNRNYTVGEELGRFNMGSTVVLIFESKDYEFHVNPGDKVQLGQKLGQIL